MAQGPIPLLAGQWITDDGIPLYDPEEHLYHARQYWTEGDFDPTLTKAMIDIWQRRISASLSVLRPKQQLDYLENYINREETELAQSAHNLPMQKQYYIFHRLALRILKMYRDAVLGNISRNLVVRQ